MATAPYGVTSNSYRDGMTEELPTSSPVTSNLDRVLHPRTWKDERDRPFEVGLFHARSDFSWSDHRRYICWGIPLRNPGDPARRELIEVCLSENSIGAQRCQYPLANTAGLKDEVAASERSVRMAAVRRSDIDRERTAESVTG